MKLKFKEDLARAKQSTDQVQMEAALKSMLERHKSDIRSMIDKHESRMKAVKKAA